MSHRALTMLLALSVAASPLAALPASADNAMGYRLLSEGEAASLPRNHGAIGMEVERSQRITDAQMSFDIMRVKGVRRGSPADQAGMRPGDQIIAVNGEVFPSIATFAAYIGSLPAGAQARVDYIPLGGGPAQAQRVAIAVAGPSQAGAMQSNTAPPPEQGGLSTGSKIAIGAGAAVLLGCYELGCFSHRHAPAPATQYQPNGQFLPNGQPRQ